MRNRGWVRRGFSLPELLVVIGIVMVLSGLLLPAVTRARRQAQATVCMNNLRQMHAAFMAYSARNRGFFPAPFPLDLRNTGYEGWAHEWPYIIVHWVLPGRELDSGQPFVRVVNGGQQLPADMIYPTPKVAPVMFCPNAPAAPALLAGYSMAMCASNSGLLEKGTSGPEAYPKWDRVKNASHKLYLSDLRKPWKGELQVLSDEDSVSGRMHGARDNFLFFDGHVEALGDGQLELSMWHCDQ